MSDKKNLSPEEKKQLAEAVHMKNVRRNIKIRCVGKMHGEKLSSKWLVFSNISKFVFLRD